MLWQKDFREEGFIPFENVAERIDECLSLINYYRHLGRDKEELQKQIELNNLRRDIVKIKKSLHRKAY